MIETRILAKRLHVQLSINRHTGYAKDNDHVSFDVDASGHIEVDLGLREVFDSNLRAFRRMSDVEIDARKRELSGLLLDVAVAEWREIGPDQRELFLTERARQALLLDEIPFMVDWEPGSEEEA